jgi:regulator of RNase E activity RraA
MENATESRAMTPALFDALRHITTGTITTVLLKKGKPIGCGGCAIFPGDVIVADDDGAVVIPQNLVEFVADEGTEHERMEGYIVGEVEKGARLPGLYPMNEETKARYEAWKKKG